MKRITLRRLFLKNWGLKLFSLILAIVLWLTLIPDEKVYSEKTLTIPLETYNIPSRIELVEKPVSTVDVTIRAPKRLMNQISGSSISCLLNLENASVHQEDYPLYPSMISLPTGAEVVNIYPNKVRLLLERTRELQLEVVPTLIGALRNGLRLEKTEVSPASVLVRGPESKLREKDKVRTVPIDLSSLVQTTDIQAELILPRPELRLAATQSRARVRVVIAESRPTGTRTSARR